MTIIMTEEIRLQKYLADCGIASRRAAEQMIVSGEVTVNGQCVSLGTKIVPVRDEVRVGRTRVNPPPADEKKVYIMLNKPRGYVTTMHDERGRDAVCDLVEIPGVRVYPVGRLDRESEGLLLLTNDGAFANRMMHPRHEVAKIYEVYLEGSVPDSVIERLRAPMTIDSYALEPVGCVLLARGPQDTVLQMELHEGRNRQIRKMCESLGLRVKKLRRIAVGQVELGMLGRGKWRELTPSERRALGIGRKETV